MKFLPVAHLVLQLRCRPSQFVGRAFRIRERVMDTGSLNTKKPVLQNKAVSKSQNEISGRVSKHWKSIDQKFQTLEAGLACTQLFFQCLENESSVFQVGTNRRAVADFT